MMKRNMIGKRIWKQKKIAGDVELQVKGAL